MSKSTTIAKAPDAAVTVATVTVDPEQTLKACKALVAHIKKAAAAPRDDGKQNLLADEESTVAETPVWLTLTTKKHIHDSNRLQPGKIALPHSLNTAEEVSVCLITADPQRWYKNAVADEFPEELRAKIGRVIDISHLKAKFKQYEAQRKLFSEHDIFLADDRIINRLPKALGKSFYKTTTKRPIPVVLMAQREKVDGKRVPAPKGKKPRRDPVENANARPIPEIVAEIEKAIGAALVHLSPSTNTAVKVGYASWEPAKIAANVATVVRELVDRFVPQKWQNVRNVYIKGPETAALPIYQTDELWLDDSKVVPEGQQPASALAGKNKALGEKPNVGKKRKSLDAEPEVVEEVAEEPRPIKKAKKAKEAVPESNDDKLDKEIAERKAKLKKQKAAAKKKADI
ncbi:ribosomal protein L1p/L10e family-domain-containing protein [Staphylotrichum tortipilum]|uniref:Ribosomal protein L1p/L10e family-domain-containing protein n=1 Tax=Staphylotrichum tortipilum TaxID=2831512 RepID=A0AAN6RRD2_9PEZI|nr:ribosomal protein L1p/L10e family-domain-containing protein [Staphylotrichum longicolle]